MPWTPPTNDPRFLRMGAWNVVIPGLPWLPGLTSSIHPERCLTWFLPEWPVEWQERILTTQASYGLTHFLQSVPYVRPTLLDHIRNDYGFKVVYMLGSKDVPQVPGYAPSPHDMTVAQWLAYVDPLLDAVLPHVDEVCPGWEWNLWNVPGDTTVQVMKHIGQRAHAAGKLCSLHFSDKVTSWQTNGTSRADFYNEIGSDVDALNYQATPTWDIGQLQSRLVDSLNLFAAQGNRVVLRQFEYKGAQEFDHDTPTEDQVCMLDYLACCTRGPAFVWGYGDDGRRPDGSWL